MQRYFRDTDEQVYELSKEDGHHIIKVMRYTLNDEIEVVNNGKLYIAKIIDLTGGIVKVQNIKETDSNTELNIQVTLAQAAVKEQKMDLILQKACELGVSDVIVVNTTRSIVKTNNKETKKIDRWNKILKEASEQSKRTKIPNVQGIMNIKDLCKLDYSVKLLCTVNENEESIKKLLPKIKSSDKIIFVIGPEGGFSNEEEETMINNDFIPVSLGKRVLRTETASIFLLSLINYELME